MIIIFIPTPLGKQQGFKVSVRQRIKILKFEDGMLSDGTFRYSGESNDYHGRTIIVDDNMDFNKIIEEETKKWNI